MRSWLERSSSDKACASPIGAMTALDAALAMSHTKHLRTNQSSDFRLHASKRGSGCDKSQAFRLAMAIVLVFSSACHFVARGGGEDRILHQ